MIHSKFRLNIFILNKCTDYLSIHESFILCGPTFEVIVGLFDWIYGNRLET